MALHDLQIEATLRLLAAKIHASLDKGAHRITRIAQQSTEDRVRTWHYIFGRSITCILSNQRLAQLMHRASVEDGFDSLARPLRDQRRGNHHAVVTQSPN